ncbi:xanthine dehydrogenase family protein subunit M [Kibdelosporangium philippinense]|uniref:Xanthine dehydrogenase family protein subunit M n=1 Tax=Kibdelosporangium philippinense TaxID=211113 RepID=A0ABS8Z8I9_9PSEU|nr:xanthine dehydrogenase family protein subunit M [Kibdelosporangium philippinense]MCE7004186.1 xanthine dehydrogenase family protein subunit M [Kibdelosporangium philippinense]
MKAFSYAQVRNVDEAVRSVASNPGATFIAGGTDLLNLMKDGAQSQDRLIDINSLPLADIRMRNGVLTIGALARMTDVAAHPLVRGNFAMLSQALLASASPQVRNMAAIGGNLLQRTRCGYYRDAGSSCNKRTPGSGCPALEGENRGHAVLGGSDHCIAVNPSDLAVALLALDATVVTNSRRIAFKELYQLPGTTPHRETALSHGELIVAVEVPMLNMKQSYLKLRDRTTFEFAVVAVGGALRMRGRVVQDVRLAFGGVATKPWRVLEAENVLRGKPLTTESMAAAADVVLRGAVARHGNAFKIELLKRAIPVILEDLR